MYRKNTTQTYKKAIVIGGISGVGKSSITIELVKRLNFVEKTISVTTRERRESEVNGKNYYFTSTKKFFELLKDGMILEYTQVLGNFYGTLKSELERIWNKGKYAVLNIDYNGIKNLEKLHIDLIKIYLLPPSYTELLRRILKRGISENEFFKRQYFIQEELRTVFGIDVKYDKLPHIQFNKLYTEKYDYIIINLDYKKTIDDIKGYILKEIYGHSKN